MVILLVLMHAFILVTSAQHTYLLLTRKHTVAYSSTEPVDVLIAIGEVLAEDIIPDVKKKVKEGTRVKVRSGETGKGKIKGRLEILNDSTIQVGDRIVPIKNIERLFVQTPFSQVSGPVISSAGIAGIIFITPIFINSFSLFEGAALSVIAGIFMVPVTAAAIVCCTVATIGGTIYFINGRVYNIKDKWHKRKGGWRIQVANTP